MDVGHLLDRLYSQSPDELGLETFPPTTEAVGRAPNAADVVPEMFDEMRRRGWVDPQVMQQLTFESLHRLSGRNRWRDLD